MRSFIILCLVISCGVVYGQKPCVQNSRLYRFDRHDEPRLFTDPLGRHPQFPFLQRVNGITTPEAFIKSIQNPAQRAKYTRTFPAFDMLLRNSGFENGYKDLNLKNVRKVYITPGTIGNLGFYNKETNVINYLYVKLNPAGESPDGVEAWKLINKDGCFLYILFTCGNAFYPNGNAVVVKGGVPVVTGAPGSGANSCKTVTVNTTTSGPAKQADSVTRLAHLRMNFYRAHLTSSHRKGIKYDTTVELIRHKDTTVHFRDRLIVPAKMDSMSRAQYYTICRDTTINLHITGDNAKQTDTTQPIRYVFADTVYDKQKPPKEETECDNSWAVSVEVGSSYNSVPRFDDNVQHTQTNGGQFTGAIEISKIMMPWFQLGVRVSYITLSYQDDVLYPGTVPGTYNTVYLAKPIIPIQLFGKFNVGKETGFQESVSIAFGFSVPTNGKIENEGNVLSTDPNLKGDFTASLKFGIAYYFTCNIGLGASFTGEYFNNKSDLIAYSLYALPVQFGLHFRF